ncbi:MAG: Sulfotransferase domain protein [Chloroflexi bacterium OLB15]|nr:MAG: Sulfotransferase domain protein [Chloroflexi bacterium OLB15]
MWVVCCGMMRSGSTLQFNLANALVQELKIGESAGFFYQPEQFTDAVTKEHDRSKWQVVKCHYWWPEVEALQQEAPVKFIYSYRDLRDVAASWVEMQQLKFDADYIRELLQDAVNHFDIWTSQPDVLVSRYETDLQANSGKEVIRIANHLNLKITEGLASDIAERCNRQAQRAKIASFDYEKEGQPMMNTRFDPATQLHNRHILNGESGRWKTVLSPVQVDQIEGWFGDWLVEHGYPLRERRWFKDGLRNTQMQVVSMWNRTRSKVRLT